MLTHIDSSNNPQMVDVADKNITRRTALASCSMILPEEVSRLFKDGDILSKKGPVFHTAIIAGTMAAKNTSQVIPFCHQLNLEKVDISIERVNQDELQISCFVKTNGKTGVEMEALYGAQVTALTIYDMCKAASKNMSIRDLKLINKTGGKSDFLRSGDE